MELPAHLQNLYRHWDRHVAPHANPISGVPDALQKFVAERMHIWERKTSGALPPYTADPVLAQYRFCNVFRELDRQTIELHQFLNPLRDDFPLWLLNMFAARLTARPETTKTVGFLSFDEAENNAWETRLLASPRPRYGTPYVFPVSVILKSTTPTRESLLARHAPRVMKAVAEEIDSWRAMPVADGVERVTKLFGFNLRFLWTEVLIDTAYQYPEKIDLFARFPLGPGSLPTFSKLAPDADPEDTVLSLSEKRMTTALTYRGKPLALSAENWEGIGCEFRKYTNLTAGVGRKRRFA